MSSNNMNVFLLMESVAVNSRRCNLIERRYPNGRVRFLRDCRLSLDELVAHLLIRYECSWCLDFQSRMCCLQS